MLCPSTISQLPRALIKNKRGDEESLFGILRNSLPIVLLLLSENFKQRQSFPWVQRERWNPLLFLICFIRHCPPDFSCTYKESTIVAMEKQPLQLFKGQGPCNSGFNGFIWTHKLSENFEFNLSSFTKKEFRVQNSLTCLDVQELWTFQLKSIARALMLNGWVKFDGPTKP